MTCPTCKGQNPPGCSCGACGIAGGRGYAWCLNNTGCPDCNGTGEMDRDQYDAYQDYLSQPE
jgi:hypothetical protein